MVEISRLYVFLALFTFVYFLESIGGSYMVSAVQNIERQFRIPSKLSGLLVSAHDISYVPTVIFVSYFGSRGNRAKWIGAGTIVIALAHIFTASPNFVYPVHPPQLNITEIEGRLEAKESLLQPDATVKDFFEYAPIRDRVPSRVRSALLEKLDNSKSSVNESPNGIEYANNSRSLYLIDEPLISDILHHIDLVIKNQEDKSELLKSLKMFVQNRQEFAESDLKTIRRAAIAPFAFCHRMVNDLRQVMKEIQCHGEASNDLY
ncbi:organic anion transporter polypeptide (OATP) family domain-containing protein [Ditylenchus destructor]|uniref:Organic anion transporter polypeptide (OATP) family domain-containing protein n=1 Tax=Ditylenchus destructor TaxID=166010 RepID=A0AAD4N3H0_9BILA|nr:organic anion transporter polypeptide (OATP) family domain-containing protein [Ditylenchus destructor]